MNNQIKDIIESEINQSEVDREDGTILIDWDSITEQVHEAVFTHITQTVTDAEDHAWLYDISELVTFNEANRIITELRQTKWCDDIISDTLSDAYEWHERQTNPNKYYGVPAL